jgi:hypothetical protein
MGAVKMRIYSSAGLEFEHLFLLVERPDASKGGIELIDKRLRASRKVLIETPIPCE